MASMQPRWLVLFALGTTATACRHSLLLQSGVRDASGVESGLDAGSDAAGLDVSDGGDTGPAIDAPDAINPMDAPTDVGIPTDVDGIPLPAVPTNALSNAAHVSAGEFHTCVAQSLGGGVYCFGWNSNGQIGQESTPDCGGACVNSAVQALGNGSYQQVSLTTIASCVRNEAGRVLCWGDGALGELGTGSAPPRNAMPSMVPTLPTVRFITTGGAHACALSSTDGSVHCWGYGEIGQFGDGMRPATPRGATQISALGTPSQIAAGDAHGCIITSTNGVRCWGATAAGQAGVQPGDDCRTTLLPGWPARCIVNPIDVAGITDVAELALGYMHTCARRTNGEVWCWGRGDMTQLGRAAADTCTMVPDETRTISVSCNSVPVRVPEIADAVRIWSGTRANHTCAELRGGRVYCWGDNSQGQIRAGAGANGIGPTAISFAEPIREIATGRFHTCAVLTTGRVVCWGGNMRGQLGIGTDGASSAPAYVVTSP